MPAPTAGVIQALALSSFDLGANPQTAPKLAKACGDVLGRAAQIFMDRVTMDAGVPCAVVPPAMAGTVAGVGRLGGLGPIEREVRIEAEKAARESGMVAADQKTFTDTLTAMTAKGFLRFQELAQVLPGTPVAGGVTAAPARLTIAVSVIKAELGTMALKMNPPRPGPPGVAAPPLSAPGGLRIGGHRAGATLPPPPPPPGPPKPVLPGDFPQIAATLVEKTLDQVATLAMVAPGIPVAGMATAAPGRLM